MTTQTAEKIDISQPAADKPPATSKPASVKTASASQPLDADKPAPAENKEACPPLPHPTQFVHLRVHSAYSLLEGALKVETLLAACENIQAPALAVCDRNNLFGALEISESLAAAGIQPIIGATLSILDKHTDKISQQPVSALALYAQNQQGYENLMKLVSVAHLDDSQKLPGVSLESLFAHKDGLICLTGGQEGPIDRLLAHGQTAKAKSYLLSLNKHFKDSLYVELQRYRADDKGSDRETQLLNFAYAHDIPIVATNQCYFENEADYQAHDALICIAAASYIADQDRRRLTPQHHFKDPQDMVALFADLPEALENTIEIARRCAIRPQVSEPILPPFTSSARTGDDSADDMADIETAPMQDKQAEAEALKQQAETGLKARLAQRKTNIEPRLYEARLAYELDVINKMGFDGYFLIVADFIQWAKKNGIAVGPGRGSGAGSVVAWALTITDLDPLQFNLLFERFLNPARVSMPDFDIDFCQHRRDEVIRYVQEKYGASRVAQIITFGKLQARAVLRDVGRVLQMPYGQVDRICKMIPQTNNAVLMMSLQQALDEEPRLQAEREKDPMVEQLFTIGLKLEGLYRHASTHAAGVVISGRPLQQLVPLYRDPKSDIPLTQFNMKWVEKAGLVKFDFLGLKTLTVLERTLSLLAAEGIEIDLANLPFEDEKTFKLLGQGDTIGIFQLESGGMRDTLRKMQPDCFEDIIALVALYRPGPMDNIDRYIACKKGEEQPTYMHELIKPILEETHGVPIYQEQVMQIAQTMSGYTLGEADLLRRAMGKKIKAEMDAQKERFIDGAMENGVDQRAASTIFDQVERFAGYGFNKSHAAAYALVAWQTAYLKANYPVAFLAASMSLDYEHTDKLHVFVRDATDHEIKISNPDINRSGALFETADNEIIYALAAIRNVGQQAVQEIINEREANGAFENLFDFASRIGGKGLNRRMLEGLIYAGALDSLEPDRARLIEGIDRILKIANRVEEDRQTQQETLFGEMGGDEEALALPNAVAWSPIERLTREFEAIGFYLSGHPLDEYMPALRRAHVMCYRDLAERKVNDVLLAGAITKIDERKSKTGRRFAFLNLSDPTGQFETIVFSETLMQAQDLLVVGNCVVLSVKVSHDTEQQRRLQAESIRPIDAVVSNNITSLRIFVEKPEALKHIKARLDDIGTPATQNGQSPTSNISIILKNETQEIELRLPNHYAITPRIASALKALAGVLHVQEHI